MRRIRTLILSLTIILVLVFSGCSKLGFGGPSNNTPDTDTSGYGLEAKFSIDTQYIQTRRLIYTLELKNSGLKEITITRNNFKLSTVQVSSQSGQINDVFTQESLSEFYQKVFSEGDLKLQHDQEKKISGTLMIDEQFFNDPNNQELEYILDTNYDYETKFVNNLEITKDYGVFKLKTSNIQQAAPIQINDIKLVPGATNNEYTLEYYFYNKGQSSSDKEISIPINNLNIVFRDQSIQASCIPRYKNNPKRSESNDINLFSVFSDDTLILECPITLNDEDNFITQTYGNFKYNYKIKIKGTINIPKKK